MTQSEPSKDFPPEFSDEGMQAFMEEHFTDLQQSVTGLRFLFQSLVVSFVVGLAAHVGGYFLLSSASSEPFGLFADLLHAFGWSLWTGVVVVVFLQILPEAKRRQVSDYLQAYEAFRRERADRATCVVLRQASEPRHYFQQAA